MVALQGQTSVDGVTGQRCAIKHNVQLGAYTTYYLTHNVLQVIPGTIPTLRHTSPGVCCILVHSFPSHTPHTLHPTRPRVFRHAKADSKVRGQIAAGVGSGWDRRGPRRRSYRLAWLDANPSLASGKLLLPSDLANVWLSRCVCARIMSPARKAVY